MAMQTRRAKERRQLVKSYLLALYPETEGDDNAMDEYRLKSYEFFWRDHYLWLEEKGYRLRPRYHPDWVASWKDTGESWVDCEDGQISTNTTLVLDATRIADGTQVMLKKLTTRDEPYEAFFGRLFSSEEHASHPSNHCVPIYDAFPIPEDEGIVLIAMPRLEDWWKSLYEFETVGEVVEFCRQIFEGLQYMHSLDIAHNDIKMNNIMMDYTPLYDDAIHPVNPRRKLDWTGASRKPRSRTIRPVNYYYIDFEFTKSYHDVDGTPLEPVGYGGDRTVPEFLTQEECNPFPVDVYRVGNVIRTYFTHGSERTKRKLGLEFMVPLLQDMCQDDSTKRPTMDEVVSQFTEIVNDLSCWKLRSRLVDERETRRARLLRFPGHWARQLGRVVRRIPATPRA